MSGYKYFGGGRKMNNKLYLLKITKVLKETECIIKGTLKDNSNSYLNVEVESYSLINDLKINKEILVIGDFTNSSNTKFKISKIIPFYEAIFHKKQENKGISFGFFRTQDKELKDIKKVSGLANEPNEIDYKCKGFIKGDVFNIFSYLPRQKVEFFINKFIKGGYKGEPNIAEATLLRSNNKEMSETIKISINGFKITKNNKYIAYGGFDPTSSEKIFKVNEFHKIVTGVIKIINTPTYYKDSLWIKAKVDFIEYNCQDGQPTDTPQVVGYFPVIFKDDKFKCEGYWYENKFGVFFRVLKHERIFPSENKLISNFLQLAVKGLGKATAKKIVDKFGVNTIEIIKKDWKQLVTIKGISEERGKKIYEKIMESILFDDIFAFLIQYNFGSDDISKIFKKYGNGTIDKITENPYCITSVNKIDFIQADNIAESIGIKYDDIRRLKAGILHFLKKESENKGDIFTFEDELKEALNDFLYKNGAYKDIEQPKLEIIQIDNAINELLIEEKIKIEKSLKEKERRCIYTSYLNYIENTIIKRLKDLTEEFKTPICTKTDIDKFITYYENSYKFRFADKQKQSIHMALTNGISILTGGPGTGKTQTINSIIKCIEYVNPKATIDLCAPTGKASKRMCELTGKEAMTIHRKLKYIPFEKDAELEPIESDFVIIDESSMIDADLFCKLIEQIDEKTRILFVGDHEQLPSVGVGLILRDLINSNKIPVTRLDEIFRQAQESQIIVNSHKIIQGINTKNGLSIDNSKKDFFFIEKSTVSGVKDNIMKSISRLVEAKGYNLEQIQILTPTNKGDLGTFSLNRTIQEVYNPYDEKKAELQISPAKIFRVGDKVIQTENNYDINVFNGSVGTITKIDINKDGIYELFVNFDGVTKIYTEDICDELMLAYALTIHKSQGSEFPIVIIPIHRSHDFMNNRNMIYTAITRAKEMVILIGTYDALDVAIDKTDNTIRNSQIIEKLNPKLTEIAC